MNERRRTWTFERPSVGTVITVATARRHAIAEKARLA